MLPIYLTKIHKVISVDTGEETKLSPNDKNVYGYLCGIGYNQGYDSIYPSVEQMAYNLSIATKSVSNSLNTLESIGLIKRKRTKHAGKWDSTFYWVYRPNMINRVHWTDVNGDLLQGKHYRFDTSQFRKIKEDIKKSDKLLFGVLKLADKERKEKEEES